MAIYEYDPIDEVFVREDRCGKRLAVNIAEAERIITYMNLGYSMDEIQSKIELVNEKGSRTTVKSFIKNYNQDNIKMPENAPAPVKFIESIEDDIKLEELEKRITELEKRVDESWLMKLKSWIQGN